MKFRSLVTVVLWSASLLASSLAEDAVVFEAVTIDDGVEIGYGLSIGDVDGDGKDDIILADKREFRWYRAPDWTPFVLAKNLTLRDNVCVASADLDGDGKVEIAVGGQWNPGETSDAEQSGSVHYLVAPEDRTQLWKPIQLPHQPTVHRMHWVGKQLVVLPLHGVGNSKDPQPDETGVNLCLNWVAPPGTPDQPGTWRFDPISTQPALHKTHNFDVDGKDIVVASAEGIFRTSIVGDGVDSLFISPKTSTPPCRGVGEVRVGREFYAAIEPIHGNDLVIYVEGGDGAPSEAWQRITLTDQLNEGHALAVGNLSGSKDSDEIVVGWRKPDADQRVGLRMFHRDADGAWQSQLIDDNDMACEDLKLADLDGDGRLDVIAAGRDSHNLKIYWNRKTVK